MQQRNKNIKLTIQYDGTGYAGWQRQKNAISVQEALEEALCSLIGNEILLTAAGRTDSGVHAKGQVANFHTQSSIPDKKFSYAINGLLPRDIRVIDSVEVPNNFHARFSAIAKRYRYSLVLHPHGTALGRNYFYHMPFPLDTDAMVKAAKHFEGTHDFSGFMSVGSRTKCAVRNIEEIRLTRQYPCLYIDITGNGFLYNMVRIIVGTLIEVGTDRMRSDQLPEIISSKDRSRAGATVPARGLCLEEVYYPMIISTKDSMLDMF